MKNLLAMADHKNRCEYQRGRQASEERNLPVLLSEKAAGGGNLRPRSESHRAQVCRQVAWTLVALVRFLLQRLGDNQSKRRRNGAAKLVERSRLLLHDLHRDGCGGGSEKRMAPSEHFVKHHTQRKDVGAEVRQTSQQDFGSHVGWGSANGGERGERLSARAVIRADNGNAACHPEIEQFHLSRL